METIITESQAFTLRLCDEVPGGVRVNKNTAKALERRGLLEITGPASGEPGVVVRVTDKGREAYQNV